MRPAVTTLALVVATACGSSLEDARTTAGEVSPARDPGGDPVAGGAGPVEPARPAAPRTYEPRPEDRVEPSQPIDNVEALAPLFDALAALDDGADRKTRVLHWGDSAIGLDQLPHAIRRRLQTRFGDGGPGFLLLKRYSKNYRPKSVRYSGTEDWSHCYIAYKCRKDGRYGLGGVTFTSSSASTTFKTLRNQPTGATVATAELWYSASPSGGHVRLIVDGKDHTTVDTRADTDEDRWARVDLDPGPHAVTVTAAGPGKSRLYGVVLETDQPGVVWDSMTMIGAFTKRLMGWDREHLATQVAHREPSLLVFTYGGNDLRRFAVGKLDLREYANEYAAVIDLAQAGAPNTPCLVLGVHDHEKSGTYDLKSEHVADAVEAQKQAAMSKGCAFFSQYHAMGGPGSYDRWRKMSPRLVELDRKHLSPHGRDRMGQMVFEAIVAGYVAHRRGAGKPPDSGI